jgi:energy-coupling factor transport system ATP-binding protein
MEMPGMKVSLAGVRAVRGDWSLSAQGTFGEGVHLVSGNVGSGKSTLALLLAGLYHQTSGTVEREGIATAMIAFQFPEFHVTGTDLERECIAWGVDPYPVLATAGLSGRTKVNPLDLSRGELKRLILACVLAKDYDLLILDEPFSSLDCTEKGRLCTTLSGRKGGITIILTHEQTHFPRVDRIWEITDGMLFDRGQLPSALDHWDHAPAVVKNLMARGRVPGNISQADLLEAACRTYD